MVKKNDKTQIPQGVHLGKFFLGILILMIGLSYLGESFGVLSIHIGYVFRHIWSILLVSLGLSLLPRSNRSLTHVGLGLSALMLMAIFYVSATNLTTTGILRLEGILIDPQSMATMAEINVKSRAVALKIEGGSQHLVEGNFQSQFLSLKTADRLVDKRQEITLDTLDYDSRFGWSNFGQNNLSTFYLLLGERLPLELNLDASAADLNLDLRRVPVKKLTLTAAASNVILTLGTLEPKLEVAVRARANALTVRAPRTVGVRFHTDTALSAKSLPDFLSNGNGVYQSKNYQTALTQADIRLSAPLSNLTVLWGDN